MKINIHMQNLYKYLSFWKVLIAALLAASFFSIEALAKTPDGQTPSEETVCDVYRGMNGPAFGLCNAYCEAMDCGDPDQHAANRACTRVNDNFEKHFGFRLPEGYNELDENNNWVNNCLVTGDLDFGDAPSSYNFDGEDFSPASHVILELDNPYIGDDPPDSEPGPLSDNAAMGDDLTDSDDEGWGEIISGSVLSPICGDVFFQGSEQTVQVDVVGEAFLNAWVDWDENGVFDEGIEHFIADAPPNAFGEIQVNFAVGNVEGTFFLRFRYSSQAGLGPVGPAPDGEVEDCTVEILRTG